MSNQAQYEYWNDQAGRTWSELQAQLDRQLAPLGLRSMQALRPTSGEHILDIGCGCGDTSLELARRVAPGGSVTGLDLSAPMLAVARARAAGVGALTFMQQDAQTAKFATRFDAAFSRFGVMFFADPVSAFTNLRHALRPGGRLAFVCWRAMAENIWMTAPLQAALRHVPPLPPDDPEAPGPFAFARQERIEAVLDASGFRDISVTAHDAPIGGFPLDTAVMLALRVGPLGRLLREFPSHAEPVAQSVRTALAGYTTPQGVIMPSATWIVTASA